MQDQPNTALLDFEDFQSIKETVSVLLDTKLMNEIKIGLDDVQKGRVASWDEVKNDF